MGQLRVAEREPTESSQRIICAPVCAVVDALDALVVLVSPAGDAVHVNRTAQEYFGLSAEAARVGWYDAIHVDDREQAATARAVGLASGGPWTMEARLLRHDGVHRRFRAKVTPVRDHAREITHWMFVLTEIEHVSALEQTFRDDRERTAALASVMPGVLVSFRRAPDGTVSFPFVSPRYFDLVGVTKEQLEDDPQAGYRFVHPDDLRSVIATVEAARQTLTPWHHTYRVNHPRRGLVWLEANALPRPDSDGGMTWHAMVVDVTERETASRAIVAAAERLRTSEERFRLVFHASPVGKLLLRLPERVVVDVNDSWLAMNRHTREDVLGRPIDLLEMSTTQEGTVALFTRVLSSDLQGPAEYEVRRGDGTVGTSEISARVFPLDGAPHAIIDHQDVSVRREAERALAESNARFTQLAESIEEVFWLSDVAKERVIYVSPGYEAIWGRSCGSLIDDPSAWLDAIHAEDRAQVQAALPKQADGNYDAEYRVVRPDGAVRWVHDKAFPVRDESGGVVGVAGVAQDITERRALELQLRQAQKLESLGSLAGGIAHDFNNWLTVIDGSTSLLLEAPGLDANSLEVLEDIKLASERAAGLTRQLLAFSRKEIVELQTVRLNEVVVDTQRMLGRLLGENLVLETQLGENLWPVRVDKGQWSQVLINLAVNARDAMPHGGNVRVETRNVTAEEFARGVALAVAAEPHVLVQVTDSGSGMSDEVKARLFEPFFTTKPVGRGTGLGLSVVHGIVTQSGGHVVVDSTPGAGTTVRLYVPALPMEEATLAPEGEKRAPVGAGSGTILLVEDENALRRFVKRTLVRAGYTVLDACDGIDALEVVARHEGPLDLVVTDLVMPRLGGRDLVQRLREARPELRVLYTTGYTNDESLKHEIAHGAAAFLAKPFAANALRERVRGLLDH